MSKDMAKSLVAAALMVAFSTPVAANTATGSRSELGAFSKQADGIVMPTNLYYSSKRVRGLRGFSCWFKPVDSSEPTKLNLYIDGVANGTTGIDEVAFGDEEPTGKAAKGIYNMNGQLVSNGSDTTNLPAGMYIVNGKKCVVR